VHYFSNNITDKKARAESLENAIVIVKILEEGEREGEGEEDLKYL
jgi:hypothetical protein